MVYYPPNPKYPSHRIQYLGWGLLCSCSRTGPQLLPGSAHPPLARGRDPITNLKTWGQSWHPLRDSQRWRGRAGEEDCANGWAGLLCLYSWSQRAVKPLLRGKARHFCTRYSFLNCQAPGRGFKHSRVHLRQHLGRPHPMCGGGKTNSAKI